MRVDGRHGLYRYGLYIPVYVAMAYVGTDDEVMADVVVAYMGMACIVLPM